AYILRHPVDAAWGWLSSVRTAILLIAAITIICLLGIYFVQAPGEVLNDPVSYASWIQQNALPRYGSLTPIFDSLQFFTIFSSWYFLLLLTILSVSIIVCTLNRAPAIWQNFKHPVIRRSEKFYQNALERASCSHPDSLAFVTAQLRKRRYRVRSITVQGTGEACPRPGSSRDGSENAGDDQPVTYLYANKNSWATLATFVFHAALVTLLMAGVLSQWHGFPQNSPARHILPAPLVSLSDSLAGFTFDQALPTGQSAVVYPRGTPHNVSFRVNNFTATFDPHTGLATDYVTDLSVYRDGQLVAHSNHLRVNDALTYNGIIFHQSSLIPSVTLTISDASGCLVCAQSIVLDQTGNAQGLQVDYARGVPIAGTAMTISIAFSHSPSVQLAQVRHPSFLISIGVPGSEQSNLKALANITIGQTATSFDKQWTITLNNAAESTVLLVTRDSGSPLIWPTAVILILSLCLTFYFPQRRIWLRIAGQRIEMAALHEHFTNIRTDLLGITRASHTSSVPLTSPRN
ncbi:MAG TPA: cytochrome c biogenesis protein ResB, partial [Ktedonobacteraceae bacterium]|nr:cytochrome c biogenesis protein ResB [Ktedonobacteraceae bacterium]